MPSSRTTFWVPLQIEAAFAYISDFRHAVWDPRVKSARQVGPGPIGEGTSFVLDSPFFGLTLHLPYRIVVYEPCHRLTLAGQTALLRYRDEITFAVEGAGTRITYAATMALRGVYQVGTPLLSRTFPRICHDAIRGLKDALEDQARDS